jgi:hypothetical protein
MREGLLLWGLCAGAGCVSSHFFFLLALGCETSMLPQAVGAPPRHPHCPPLPDPPLATCSVYERMLGLIAPGLGSVVTWGRGSMVLCVCTVNMGGFRFGGGPVPGAWLPLPGLCPTHPPPLTLHAHAHRHPITCASRITLPASVLPRPAVRLGAQSVPWCLWCARSWHAALP